MLTPHQKEALHTLFQQNPYPGITTRTQLAQEIGVAESRIQVGGTFSFTWSRGQFVDRMWAKSLEVTPQGQLAGSGDVDAFFCHDVWRRKGHKTVMGVPCRRRTAQLRSAPPPV